MKKIMLINADLGGVSRSIRACYGKCGFMSFFLGTGHGITGVVEYESDELCDTWKKQR